MLWTTLNSERVSPFTQLRQLQDEVRNLFDCYQGDSNALPPVNIWNNEGNIVMTVELPGVDPKDININVLGDQLTLEGEKKSEEVKDNAVFLRRERDAGRFSRVFRLPFDINDEKVSAKFNNGILTIYMPKSEKAKPKKIEILNAEK